MKKVFYNILLPVFLRKNTGTSLARAVQLANSLECNLHVIYTLPPLSSIQEIIPGRYRKLTAQKKTALGLLQQKFEPSMQKGSLYISQFLHGDPLERIVEYAFSRSIDLICYDEVTSLLHPASVNVRRLSELAHCPVLTGGSIGKNQVEKIVLPIDDQLSAERLRVAIFMAQQLGAAIHLVGETGDYGHTRNMMYLKKAYEMLKDNTSLELVCSSVTGTDGIQSAMQYAQSVHAGLIVMKRPQSEQKLSMGYGPGIGQRLAAWNRSKIPILMV